MDDNGKTASAAARRDNAVANPRDRRAEIRLLAAQLFFERGYESTTIRQIASALNIRAASLYYHFPDKEQILFELLDSVLRQLTEGARIAASREQTPELQLAGIVVNHVVLHALRPRESTLGDSELRSLTGERLAKNLEHRDQYERLVMQVLQDGERAGHFRLLDPKLTAYAIIAESSHVGTWFREPGRLQLRDVAEVHTGFALRLVGADAVPANDVARLVDDLQRFHRDYITAFERGEA